MNNQKKRIVILNDAQLIIIFPMKTVIMTHPKILYTFEKGFPGEEGRVFKNQKKYF